MPVAPERSGLMDEFSEWFRGWLPAMKKMTGHA
jgi:hypothetical protein